MSKLENILNRAFDVTAHNAENPRSVPIKLKDYDIFITGDDEPVETVYCHACEEDALEDYNTNYTDSDHLLAKATHAKEVV